MHGVPTVGLRLRCDALGTGIARGTGRQWRTPICLVLEANAEARAMAACPPPRCRVACEAVTPGRLFAHDRSRPADWRGTSAGRTFSIICRTGAYEDLDRGMTPRARQQFKEASSWPTRDP